MEKIKETKKQLKRKLAISESSDIFTLARAYKNLDNLKNKNYMGSGITLTVKNINSENFTICDEFCIIDGLSTETIEAIKKDIKRTYDLKLSLIPKI